MTKRKHELSLMNVILCLFVIFIHASSTAVTVVDKSSWEYALLLPAWRLAACAVPGFIFLSAVKFAKSMKKDGFSYPKYVLGRIKRVWIPYAIAAVVYYIYFILFNYMEPSVKEFFILLLDGNIGGHFYFVVIIMQFYLLAPLWRVAAGKLSEPVFAAAALITALPLGWIFGQYLADFIAILFKGAAFMYADRVFTTYIFWWMLGLCVGVHYERVKAVIAGAFKGTAVLFGFGAVLNGGLSYLHFSGKAYVYWLETAHVLYIICAIIFLLSLSVKLSEMPVFSHPLIMLTDRSSYSIYLWHPLFLYFAKSLLGGRDVSLVFTYAVHLFFAFAVTMTVCIGVTAAADAIRRKRNS